MKIKKTLFNLKIFLVGFFIFTFSLPLAFSNTENAVTGTGTVTESTEEKKEGDEKNGFLEGKRRLYIFNKDSKDFSSFYNEEIKPKIGTKSYYDGGHYIATSPTFNNFNSFHGAFYKYVNPKGETIVFSKNGHYTNITTGESFKNLFVENGNCSQNIPSDHYNIIDHNDYIIFFKNQGGYANSCAGFGGIYLNIYSKKHNKFVNFAIGIYHDFFEKIPGEIYKKNERGLYNFSYGETHNRSHNTYSYQIEGNTLTFNSLYNYGSNGDALGIENYSINFDDLTDELFLEHNDKLFLPGVKFKQKFFDENLENFKKYVEFNKNQINGPYGAGNKYFGTNDTNGLLYRILRYGEYQYRDWSLTQEYKIKQIITQDDFENTLYYVDLDDFSYSRAGGYKKYKEFSSLGIKQPFRSSYLPLLSLKGISYEYYFFGPNYMRLKYGGILFFKNGLGFYTNSNGGLSYAYNWKEDEIVESDGKVSYIYSGMKIKDIGNKFVNLFSNYTLLDFSVASEEGKRFYYLSYLLNGRFKLLKFEGFSNNDSFWSWGEEFDESSVVDGFYYLGSIGTKGTNTPLLVFLDQSALSFPSFNKTNGFANFFIGKYRGELRFFYFSENGYYISKTDILGKSKFGFS